MKRLPLVLGLVFALVFLVSIGCEKEVVKEVTVHDTVTVEIQVSNITVDTVTADPGQNITPGQMIQLVAEVSTEEGIDMNSLKYEWFADAGELTTTSMDTANWKAADSTGTYTVSVHVSSDNQYIGIGSRKLGVGEYAPQAAVYYVGVSTCNNCHEGTATSWAETGHAEAWAGLQTSDHAASYCEPCHSVQQDETEGNSGYDEVPTAKFEDVQCESCHGPGSDHPGSAASETIPTNADEALSAETCGICHEGSHHPTYAEWELSPHNFDPFTWDGGILTQGFAGGCRNCHEGIIAAQRMSQTDPNLLIDAAAVTDQAHPVTCGVCHDPHSADHEGQLRTLADVNFVQNTSDHDGNQQEVASGNGTGQVCIQCHHARRPPVGTDVEGSAIDQIADGYAHLGPHPGTQADVVYGESGYEDVADVSMVFASSGHGLIADACATCHVHAIPFDVFEPDSAYTGHTFLPRVEACEQCHGTITSFADIMAKKDYDNDGSMEGIQDEVAGLMELLVDNLYADFAADYVGTNPAITVSTMLDSLVATDGETGAEAVRFREAGYNLAFAEEDGSHGVHNPAYIIQLLQQSILFLDPAAIPPSNQLRDGERQATTFAAR